MRNRLAVLLALPLAASALSAHAAPSYTGDPVAEGVGKDLVPVAHIGYERGSDIEFATIKRRDYAIAPSTRDGLRIIDITNPERPKVVGKLECRTTQNDVQVRGSLVLMGVDSGGGTGACFKQAKAEPGSEGLFVISIADPRKPRAIGFVELPLGVHNSTWHPGGKYVYVSDSELTPKPNEKVGAWGGRMQIVDVSVPTKPRYVGTMALPANVASTHDITFNKKGDRAYFAAITTTLVVDTSQPAEPAIISTIVDPSINISHGADPTPDGKYLLVTDEQSGAAFNGVCNVGGVHVFDLTVERAPVKVGFWSYDPTNSLTATRDTGNMTCTAHVLDYAPDGKSWTNGNYAAGVRVISATNVLGRPTELAWFTPDDADTWAAKTYKSSKYVFANDLNRGFDVYKWVKGKGNVDTRRNPGAVRFRPPTRFGPGEYCFTVKQS